MNAQKLIDTARALVAGDKELLAMDGRKSAPHGGSSAPASVTTKWEPDMRQRFVIGNWKMYTTAAEARRLAKAVVDGMGIEDSMNADQFLAIVRAGINAPQTKGKSA